jgi:hypothetical protein
MTVAPNYGTSIENQTPKLVNKIYHTGGGGAIKNMFNSSNVSNILKADNDGYSGTYSVSSNFF